MAKTNTKKNNRNVESSNNPALNKDKERNFITIEELVGGLIN